MTPATTSKSGFQPRTAMCMCLCAGITLLLIALESCSNPQKTQQVFESAMKKFFDFAFWIFYE